MIITKFAKVVRVKNIDDGTTGGKDIYIDNYGNTWEPTNYTKDTAPTGETVGYLKSNGEIYT